MNEEASASDLGDATKAAKTHTPLPWKAVTPCPGECCWHVVPASFDETLLRSENWHEIVNLPEMSKEDAALIVRAVNCHQELVNAMRNLLARAVTELADPEDVTEIAAARFALSRAAAEGSTQ